MFAAAFGFAVCVVIAVLFTIFTLAVLSWPGSRGEKWIITAICIGVWFFVSYINPFYVQITVTGP